MWKSAAMDIMFLFAMFTEGTGNIFRRFGDARHIYQDFFFYFASKVYELNKPAVSY
jgi:hypothetical protein